MRPLPKGLRLCETCGEACGTTREGRVSACFCSGDECTWCGIVIRRPITDTYDHRDGRWSHVPFFNEMTHRCQAPAERRVGRQWHSRTPDPDVRRYQEAMTELAWAVIADDDRPRD